MAVVDSQGKLFGKYNLIDVLVVLIVVLALAFVARQFLPWSDQKYVYITVGLGSTDTWFANAINVGDYAGSPGNESAIITDMVQLDRGRTGKRDVILRIKLAADLKGTQWHYGEQKLTIGSPLEIDTLKASFGGTIWDVNEEGEMIELQTTRKILTIESNNLPDWKYSDLKIGLIQETPDGTALAEITDIKRIKVARTGVADFLIKVEIEAEIRGEELYFKGREVLLGTSVSVKFGRVEIRGNVIDIEDVTEDNKIIIVTPIEKVVEITSNNVPVSLAESVTIGDQEKDSEGNAISEVLEVYSSFASETQRNLIVRLKVSGELIKGEIFFKGNKLVAGQAVTFSSENVLLSGEVNNVYDTGTTIPQLETAVSKVIEMNVSGWLSYKADAIPLGVIEQDPIDGEVVIEILSKNVSPHITVVTTNDGKLLKREHPLLKDITLRVRLLFAKSPKGELYFKGSEIKIGNQITIETTTVDISGEVISFEEN